MQEISAQMVKSVKSKHVIVFIWLQKWPTMDELCQVLLGFGSIPEHQKIIIIEKDGMFWDSSMFRDVPCS